MWQRVTSAREFERGAVARVSVVFIFFRRRRWHAHHTPRRRSKCTTTPHAPGKRRGDRGQNACGRSPVYTLTYLRHNRLGDALFPVPIGRSFELVASGFLTLIERRVPLERAYLAHHHMYAGRQSTYRVRVRGQYKHPSRAVWRARPLIGG